MRAAREFVALEDPRARVIRLTVEYDGAHFSGWQLQNGQRTVQGALEEALSIICRHPVVVRGAGRTDAGVHAWAQVAAFRTTSAIEVRRVVRGVNGLAGPGVRVVDAVEVGRSFDARRDAVGKVYAYQLLLRPEPSALLAGRAWHLRAPLDRDLLCRELATVPAATDWTSFAATDGGDPNPHKEVWSAELELLPHSLAVLRFSGSGFLKQMVRTMVGTLVDVAQARRPPGGFVAARQALDRRQAGPTAPAHGLFLEEVRYP